MPGIRGIVKTWLWIEEWWNRHARYRDLYRQLDAWRDDFKARSAWVDALTDDELEEMQQRLADCIEAIQGTAGEASEPPGGAS
ncbi:hypothetical protein [Streptomyces sp. WZ-12]|uniref:hypothetical protein n=1 Tax=Streptomyces sp. WZ-12 TaxID=3030210 RepID=UPI002380F11F|nr:hypothetical protein [Streptomyces sp. WZ-12]